MVSPFEYRIYKYLICNLYVECLPVVALHCRAARRKLTMVQVGLNSMRNRMGDRQGFCEKWESGTQWARRLAAKRMGAKKAPTKMRVL